MLTCQELGNTGLNVSEFCFGLLPIGPIQANKSEAEMITLITESMNYGVTFFDTAEMYQTEKVLGKAIRGKRDQVVISSKSMSKTYDDMAKSFSQSLKNLETDYIDIYHLHAAKVSGDVFHERAGALRFLNKMKEQKTLRAVGISTHHIQAVNMAARRDDIDVIFPLINISGYGILGGGRDDMLRAIRLAHQNGKGLFGMKVFAGGNLLNRYHEALEWARSINEISSLAIGVIDLKELKMNLKMMGVESISDDAIFVPESVKKLSILKLLCIGCGNCVEACPNDALSLVDGKAHVDSSKCVLCGYCSPHCEPLAIRLL